MWSMSRWLNGGLPHPDELRDGFSTEKKLTVAEHDLKWLIGRMRMLDAYGLLVNPETPQIIKDLICKIHELKP